jgi:hypothetical protein
VVPRALRLKQRCGASRQCNGEALISSIMHH